MKTFCSHVCLQCLKKHKNAVDVKFNDIACQKSVRRVLVIITLKMLQVITTCCFLVHIYTLSYLFLQGAVTPRPVKGKSHGFYAGLAIDKHGNILATKSEKGRSFIEVHRIEDSTLFYIDSYNDKLKRPSGLITTDDYHVYVCDLGNDSLKKYKYR